jgi:non-homologous end joining protein Ku
VAAHKNASNVVDFVSLLKKSLDAKGRRSTAARSASRRRSR